MRVLCTLLVLVALPLAAETRVGRPLTQKQQVPIDKLTAQPEQYTGKTVQVKGKVTEVCQMMGCWMQIVDPGSKKAVRIKVNDGEMFFPKDAAGKTALAEGKWTKIALTEEQATAWAKHEAEEQGRPFKPESVTGPMVIYQIQGTGAVLQD
jgi:hypothetical protein